MMFISGINHKKYNLPAAKAVKFKEEDKLLIKIKG